MISNGEGDNKKTHLIHLEQRPLLHPLQSTHLTCLLLSGQKDLAISSLADLSNDVELL